MQASEELKTFNEGRLKHTSATKTRNLSFVRSGVAVPDADSGETREGTGVGETVMN